ncbi:hypothetical protein ANAEL_01522 [Anaerolineales bacterium]|nr:hypothetical protein ANAEL_01522 [Anaerolineales bacterium]
MTTFPNKTTVSAPMANKQTGRLGLNIFLVILLALTILSIPADGIHIVGGILLMLGSVIHLILHRRWLQSVILEPPKNVTPVLIRQRRLFWGMFLSGSLCGLSGLIMLPIAFDPHAFLLLHCCGTPIHILSGLTFLGLNIYHLILHRNWFAARLGFARK